MEINLNYEETRFCAAVGRYAVDTEGRVFESGNVSCSMGEPVGINLKETAGKK